MYVVFYFDCLSLEDGITWHLLMISRIMGGFIFWRIKVMFLACFKLSELMLKKSHKFYCILQSGKRGEYTFTTFCNYCKQHSIHQQFTQPKMVWWNKKTKLREVNLFTLGWQWQSQLGCEFHHWRTLCQFINKRN
jgi:hypothetical protein